MGIAWNALDNHYDPSQIRANQHQEKGPFEIRYSAKIGTRVFEIKVLMTSDLAAQQNESSIFQMIRDVALRASQLMTEDPSFAPSVSFDGESAAIDESEWNRNRTTTATTTLSEFKGRISAFSAEIKANSNDIENMKSIYHKKIRDPDIQRDMDKMLDCLLSPLSKFTTHEIQVCMQAFQEIDNPHEREALLQAMNQAQYMNSAKLLDIALSKKLDEFALFFVEAIKIPLIDQGGSAITAAFQKKTVNINLIRELLKHPEVIVDNETVFKVIRNFRDDIVKELLHAERIANPNENIRGDTLLTMASHLGLANIVEELLKIKEIDVNQADSAGNTPLRCALTSARDTSIDVFKVLLNDPRIDPNGLDPKQFPIILSAYLQYEDYPEFLIEILKHPRLDIAPLLRTFEMHPERFYGKQFELIYQAFPIQVEGWLKVHPEMRVAQWICAGKLDEAKEWLMKAFESNQPLDIVRLFKVDPSICEWIEKSLHEPLCKWLGNNKVMDRLNLEEQRLIMFYVYPQFYQFMDSRGTLGYRGIEMAVEYLRKKKSLPLEDCITVCQDRETFSKTLQALGENAQISDGYVHYFIITKFDANPHGIPGHVTPIYLKKVEGSWEVVITDSTTDQTNIDKPTSSCEPLVTRLVQMEQKMQGKFPIRHIHVNAFWRQSDDNSCPIFALRDIVFFHKNRDQFLNQLISASTKKVQSFSGLPPELMKMTQSIRELEKYARGKSSDQLMMSTKKAQGKETLLENLERHKMTSSKGKARNVMASDRSIKYQRMIMKDLITQLLSS